MTKPNFLLICLIMLILATAVSAQDNCYQTFYQSGLERYKVHDFDAAIKSFKAAKVCSDKPADNDVDNRIVEAQNGYIEAIRKERNKARSLALTAKSILELQKNNDVVKAFRYAQYALQIDDNFDSRSAFYESVYQLEFEDRRLLYQHSFSAFDTYPQDLANANFLESNEHILAYSSLGHLRVYSQEGEILAEQKTSGRRGNPILFQSSGNLIAYLQQGKEQLNVVDFGKAKDFGTKVFSVSENESRIEVYRFSPDGKYLAVGFDNGKILLFDRSGALVQEFHHAQKRIENFSFSTDNELLTASDAGGSIQLWNTAGGLVDTIQIDRGYEIALEIAPDKRHLLLKTTSRKLRLVNLRGEVVYAQRDHLGPILSSNFSPDGKFVAIDNKLINLQKGSSYGEVFKEIGNDVNQIRYSPDGRFLLATGRDEKAYLWRMWGGWRLYAVLGSHTDRILNAKFSRDGKHILTAGRENRIKIWPLSMSIATTHSEAGKLLQALEIEDSVYVNTNKAQHLHIYNAHSGWYGTKTLPVDDIIIQSQNGRFLLTQEKRQLGIWTFGLDADSLRWIAGVSGFNNVLQAAFSPTQKVVAIYNEDNGSIGVQLWDFNTHQTRFLGGWSGEITCLEWSSDGNRLFGGSINGEMYTWDYSDGFENVTLIHKEKPHDPNPVKAIAVSANGRYMVTSPLFSTEQKISDFNTGQTIIFNCQCQANAIRFSPDSRYFISAQDRTAHIRDPSGQLLVNLNVGKIEVKRACFSNDARYVITNYADGSVTVWPFDPDLIIRRMESFGIPDLSKSEKEKYGVD